MPDGKVAEFAEHLNIAGRQAMSNSKLFRSIQEAIKSHEKYKGMSVQEAIGAWRPEPKADATTAVSTTSLPAPANHEPTKGYFDRRTDPVQVKVDVAAPVINVPATEVLSAYHIAEWSQTFLFGLVVGVLFSRLALKALGLSS